MSEMDWHLLKQLCDLHAVSGREDIAIKYIHETIQPYVDESYIDNIGNVVGILLGAGEPETKLMLQAHMDELGLIIRNITPDGFLQIERVGGIPEKSLPGQQVEILTDTGRIIHGIIGAKSHHVTKPEEKFVVPPIQTQFIDVGLPDAMAVQAAGINIGDPVTYTPNFHFLGDDQICSKSLDNRVGVFLLIEALKKLSANRPACTIIFAFTVLEEFSIRGSLPVVTKNDPSAIISLDITISTDTPAEVKGLQPVAMGHGPCIKMMDFHGRGTLGGLFSSPPLRRFIESCASNLGIPLQREVIVGVITDPAFQIYLGNEGYAAAGLSIPQRYSHSPVSTISKKDIVRTFDLMTDIATKFNHHVPLKRG